MLKFSIKERRRFVRAKRVLSIQYRLYRTNRKNADKSWHLSTTHDMSVGGVTFYTDQEYRVGEILQIHVVMSGLLDIFKGYAKILRIERKKTAAYFFVAVKLMDKIKERRDSRGRSMRRTSKTTKRKRL